MPRLERIQPCLWFDSQAEEAARQYTAIFPNSRIGAITRYTEVGQELHRKAPGTAMTLELELDGQSLLALNGGPQFRFTEAISLIVHCDSQAEIDHYWARLGEGGDPAAQQCGWLKDRFGLSWQIVPRRWSEMMASSNTAGIQCALALMFTMQKLDMDALQRAYDGA
ncbi:MAG: VOC family protein [Comamonas sp.]